MFEVNAPGTRKTSKAPSAATRPRPRAGACPDDQRARAHSHCGNLMRRLWASIATLCADVAQERRIAVI